MNTSRKPLKIHGGKNRASMTTRKAKNKTSTGNNQHIKTKKDEDILLSLLHEDISH